MSVMDPMPADVYGGGAPTAPQQPAQPSPQQMQQMRMQMERRRKLFEEKRKAREQQRAIERIRQQVVYAPALGVNPKASGYAPMVPQLNAQRDPRLGIPLGVDTRELSPEDQALYQQMLASR